jgi:uncharacterized membrane protein YgdD (TMEM256/DUF423 family)
LKLRRAVSSIVLFAALEGAAGVVLAAVAAHVEKSPLLATSSEFLMLHAGAGVGLAALALAASSRALVFSTYALQAGVALFSADLALRALGPGKLFPYAAPIGGSLTILAWLAVAAWAARRALRGKSDAP